MKIFGNCNNSNWRLLCQNKFVKEENVALLFLYSKPRAIFNWLENMTKTLALYPLNYANLIIEGHSNVGIENNYMEDFCDKCNNKTLKELTCY